MGGGGVGVTVRGIEWNVLPCCFERLNVFKTATVHLAMFLLVTWYMAYMRSFTFRGHSKARDMYMHMGGGPSPGRAPAGLGGPYTRCACSALSAKLAILHALVTQFCVIRNDVVSVSPPCV